jgi:putative phage-type endonuclease
MLALAPRIAPFTVVCCSQDREHWLTQRAHTLGASESASVLGLNPWGSQLQVWASKMRIAVPQQDSEPLFWGLQLEDAIIKGYEKRTGRASIPFGLMLQSVRWPWLSATPDALTTSDETAARRALPILHAISAIRRALRDGNPTAALVAELVDLCAGWWPLQTKNIGFGSAEHWVEGVPLYYRVQCAQEALVFGAQRCTGAALIAGQRLAWDDVDVDLDGVLERQIVNLTHTFWHAYVLPKKEPRADGSASARAALAAIYPVEQPETVAALGHDMMELAYERQALKREMATLAARVLAVENELKQAIGDRAKVVFPDGSALTHRTVCKKEYVVPAQQYRELRHQKARKD